MIATDCSVKFYWLVPKDLNTTPYVVFASQGVHQHPPPPPTTTPGWIKAKIQEIIQKENTLTLTCGMYLYCIYIVFTLQNSAYNTSIPEAKSALKGLPS